MYSCIRSFFHVFSSSGRTKLEHLLKASWRRCKGWEPAEAELEAAAGFPEGGAPDGPSAEALERAAALLQGAAASTLDGPSSAELEAAAALIQGAAAAALDPNSAGPSAEDLERATGLIQDAAAARPDGPSSSELEAAAALIQGVAPRP